MNYTRAWGQKTKYKFTSPHTTDTHIKIFELPSDAYYWAMQNLDISLQWKMQPIEEILPKELEK